MGTSITFKRPDGKDANGYLANAARGNAPGVIVIQEWWGLSEQIKGLCDRFAVAGAIPQACASQLLSPDRACKPWSSRLPGHAFL